MEDHFKSEERRGGESLERGDAGREGARNRALNAFDRLSLKYLLNEGVCKSQSREWEKKGEPPAPLSD